MEDRRFDQRLENRETAEALRELFGSDEEARPRAEKTDAVETQRALLREHANLQRPGRR